MDSGFERLRIIALDVQRLKVQAGPAEQSTYTLTQINERLDRARRLQLAVARPCDLIFLENDGPARVIQNDPKMRKHLAT